MSDVNPIRSDYRRAAVLVRHHLRRDPAGINEILREAVAADAVLGLLRALVQWTAAVLAVATPPGRTPGEVWDEVTATTVALENGAEPDDFGVTPKDPA